LYANIVFSGTLFQLIELIGGVRRIFEHWLMLSDPLIAFYPEILLFYVNGLLCPSRFTCGQLSACATQRGKDPAQDHEVEQHDCGAADDPRKHTLTWIHSLIPGRNHRGLPSNRNCAWSFGKMRGAAISN